MDAGTDEIPLRTAEGGRMKYADRYIRVKLKELRKEQEENYQVDREWTAEKGSDKMSVSHKWLRQRIRELDKLIQELEETLKIIKNG